MNTATLSPEAPAGAKDIPSLDRLLRSPEFAPLLQAYGHTQVGQLMRACLQDLRDAALQGKLDRSALDTPALAQALQARLAARNESRLRPVYNLTGTVLHTNLGRALLPDQSVQAVVRALTSPPTWNSTWKPADEATGTT